MATNKFEKMLSESNLDTDSKQAITEAWETQIAEAKLEVAAELREEFSRKFEHDKKILVSSMDKFLHDKITVEMAELAEDRKSLVSERIKYKTQIKEHASILNKFLVEQLSSEVKQFAGERKQMKENVQRLEGFLIKKLHEEILDFRADKQKLVEQRVKLVKEGKEQLQEAKTAFIKKAAVVIEENVNNILRTEITQYRNDIASAKENNFGRRIFEAFAGEYLTSYLNEGSEVKKLHKVLESREAKIAELQTDLNKTQTLVESTAAKLNVAKDMAKRTKELTALLAPLGNEKRKVMEELLSTVPTEKLVESYKKYLPAVLNERVNTNRVSQNKTTLVESVKTEKTGNRTVTDTTEDSSLKSELDQIRALAGIIK